MNPTIEPATLTRAVMRTAEQLNLAEALPDILGMAESDVLRMTTGVSALDPGEPQWHAALRFVSLYRSLLLLLGSSEKARGWLGSPNETLGAAPAVLLRTPDGRQRLHRYVDAVQKYELKMPPP